MTAGRGRRYPHGSREPWTSFAGERAHPVAEPQVTGRRRSWLVADCDDEGWRRTRAVFIACGACGACFWR